MILEPEMLKKSIKPSKAVVPNLSRLAAPCRRELYFAAPSGAPYNFALRFDDSLKMYF